MATDEKAPALSVNSENTITQNRHDESIDISEDSSTSTVKLRTVTEVNISDTSQGIGECLTSEKLENCKMEESSKEKIDFKLVFNKQRFDVSFPLDETVTSLKSHVEKLTGVPADMQKLMYKGLIKEDRVLRELGLVKGAKVMVVGSTLNDVLAVSPPEKQTLVEEKPTVTEKQSFCKQKMHKTIIDKGVPEEAMPGIKNAKDSLPPFPLSGMLNKSGGKVRLTFKLELDQLWIGTKERTEKIPMNSIKNVVSEPIEGHEEYHLMGIQLGPTEASRYWVYWVPVQYIDAIKDAILGKWQYFG